MAGADDGTEPTRLLRITFRDGSELTVEPTMGAMAFAETQGLNPISSPVAYMACVAHRVLQKQRGARGMPATWLEWAESDNRPAKIEYVNTETMPDPTFGLPESA